MKRMESDQGHGQREAANAREAVAEAFRRFRGAVGALPDPEAFKASLDAAVRRDPAFAAWIFEPPAEAEEGARAELTFQKGEVVLPLAEGASESYLKVRGRRDDEPFAAEDFHLMGATAEFVGSLVDRAEAWRADRRRAAALRLLLDQLPVGVAAFDEGGGLAAGNARGRAMLGVDATADAAAWREARERLEASVPPGGEGHAAIGGRLLFAVSRDCASDEAGGLRVYALHDLSAQTERLFNWIDRHYFKSRQQALPLALALCRSRDRPGFAMEVFRRSGEAMGVDAGNIQPVDAYTCACVFPEVAPATARRRLRQAAEATGAACHAAVVPARNERAGEATPSEQSLAAAEAELAPWAEAVAPRVLVIDAYPSAKDALELILDGACAFARSDRFADLAEQAGEGGWEAVVVDADVWGADAWRREAEALRQTSPEIRLIASTCRPAAEARALKGIAADVPVLEKPFDARAARGALSAALAPLSRLDGGEMRGDAPETSRPRRTQE